MKTMTLEIPRVPCSMNKIMRMNWRKQRRQQGLWNVEIFTAFSNLPREKRIKFSGRVEVKIYLYFKTERCRDNDNYPKMLLDALRNNKIIDDDSSDLCSHTVNIQSGDQDRTVIIVEGERIWNDTH